MQPTQTNTLKALTLARSVLPAYALIYDDGHRLQAALDQGDPPAAVAAIMQAAMTAAEQYNGDDEAHSDALFQAADAAETVWLALHPSPDMECLEEAADAALNGRQVMNLQIFNPQTQRWE